VILGKYPFIGGKEVYNFSPKLMFNLDTKGIKLLNDATNRRKWLTSLDLELDGPLVGEWNAFIK